MSDRPRIEDTIDAAVKKAKNKIDVRCVKCGGSGGIMWRDGEEKEWEVCDACNGTGESDCKKVAAAIAEVCKSGYDPEAIIMQPDFNDITDKVDNAQIKAICEKALTLWGEEAQIKMAVEECAELIVKIVKLGRFKNGSEISEVVNEIADVEIMMAQMRLIFGSDAVDDAKKRKLQRLLARIVSSERGE